MTKPIVHRALVRLVTLLLACAGHAAISEIAATTAIGTNGTTSSIALSVPNGTIGGDVLLAQISASHTGETITAPSGWTAIRSDSQSLLTLGLTQALFYHVATTSEPAAYTFSLSSNAWVAASAITFRGVNNTSPLVGFSGQGGVLLLATAPAVSGCPAGAMQVGFFGFATGALGLTIGSGITPYATTTTNPLLGVTIINGGFLLANAGPCAALTTLAVSAQANAAQQVVLNPSATSTVILNHFQMNPPSSGLTCVPQNITVSACLDAGCNNVYNGSVAVTLAPSSGWSAGAAETLSNGTGTFAFQPTAAGTYTVSVSTSSPPVAGATTCPSGGNGNCSIQIYSSALIFSPAIPNQVAGLRSATITLAALGTNPATQQCIPAFANVTRNVAFWSSYQNPTSGTKSLTLTANPSGTTSTATISGASPGTPLSLAFNANGQAQINLTYPDVGQIGLNALYTGSLVTGDLGLSMPGNGSFVVKPYTLTVSNVKSTSAGSAPPSNPTSASSPLFAHAGDSLTMTVTASNAAGSATPNFGLETTPQGSVIVATLVAPSGGTLGTAQSASGNSAFGGYLLSSGFSAGAATLNDLVWNEVGIIQLTPHVGNSSGLGYLGAGDLGSGDGSILTASGNLGRFAPHHFTLSSSNLVNRSDLSCSPASIFTYLGEPFLAQATLTAQALAGTTTRNYDGTLGFAKLSTSAALGTVVANISSGTTTPLSSRIMLAGSAPTWSSGVSHLSQTLSISRAATPDGIFANAYVGMAPADSDGVTLTSGALNLDANGVGAPQYQSLGSTELFYGILKLNNAQGSEQLDLPIPATLQYWNSGFTQNLSDNCTVVLPSGVGVVSLGNYLGGLSTSNMGTSHIELGTAPVNANQGVISLTMQKPSDGARGSVDLTMNLVANGFSYLDGPTTGGNFNSSLQPWARAAFGFYQSSQPLIYIRENY